MASTRAKFGFVRGSSIIDVAELPNPVVKSAINPTGSYDKIYFNTSLTPDEVNNIISKVKMSDISSIAPYSAPMHIIYANASSGLCLVCMYDTYDNAGEEIISTSIASIIFDGNEVDYSSVVGIYQGNKLGNPYGWLIDKPAYEIDLTNGVDNFNGLITIGLQNDLLKDLVYVEEVDESKINTKALYRLPDGTLWHYFNGQWNAVGSNTESGTAINPLGTYNKLYFNTSLSTEEVDAMLSQLEYMKYDDIDTYGILVNSAFTRGILVMKGAFGETPFYIIAYQNQELNEMITIYSSASTGWQDESYSEFEFGSITGINEIVGTPIGHQNELLKNLISATPFNSSSSNGIIEVDTLPTENINTEAIYKLNAKDAYFNLTSMGLVGFSGDLGMPLLFVDNLPTENIDSSFLYFLTTDNKIYMYEEGSFIDFETMMGVSFKGEITDISNATEEGYYLMPVVEYYTYGDDWFKLTMTKKDMVYHALTNTQIKTITEIYDERVLEVIPGAFNYCEKLEKIKLPNCFRIEPHAFMYCRNLKVIDILGGVIGLEAFTVNAYDRTYIIRSTEGVCNFGNFNDLINMGIAKWYVPDELVETYKADTNYAFIVDKILPLSEYKED